MSMSDPIADYLTRIRNAGQAHRKRVEIPASRLKKQITQLLLDQKYIASFTNVEDSKQGIIRITLKYADGQSVIRGLKRISRPGIRTYEPAVKIPRVKNGLGIAIVSTSKGVMTDKQARKENIGGEILCLVW